MHDTTMATSRLERAMAAIESLDLEPIRFKIACPEDGLGWTSEHADRIELAYRRFLGMRAKYPHLQMAPTRDLDSFWHAHILDTRKYAADCERIFGEFVHHYPYLGLMGDRDKLQEAADTLRDLFRSEFGAELPSNARRDEAGGAAAWCGGDQPRPDVTAAWCGGEPVRPGVSAAWCGMEPPMARPVASVLLS
jgi:hypothetical protein